MVDIYPKRNRPYSGNSNLYSSVNLLVRVILGSREIIVRHILVELTTYPDGITTYHFNYHWFHCYCGILYWYKILMGLQQKISRYRSKIKMIHYPVTCKMLRDGKSKEGACLGCRADKGAEGAPGDVPGVDGRADGHTPANGQRMGTGSV